MTAFEMNKIVRDAIPGKMRAENQAPIYRTVSGRELQRTLLEKLKEEVDEALAAIEDDGEFLGEAADIQEVLDALLRARGIGREQLDAARADKTARRGAFEKGYYIETITMEEGSEWADYYREQPLRYRELLGADKDPAQHFTLPDLEKGLYRHYRGKFYDVLGLGCHTETGEFFVAYRALYKKEFNPEIWIRPYESFIDLVKKDGISIPRFEKL